MTIVTIAPPHIITCIRRLIRRASNFHYRWKFTYWYAGERAYTKCWPRPPKRKLNRFVSASRASALFTFKILIKLSRTMRWKKKRGYLNAPFYMLPKWPAGRIKGYMLIYTRTKHNIYYPYLRELACLLSPVRQRVFDTFTVKFGVFSCHVQPHVS